MSTVKKITIKAGGFSPETKDVGAEAPYVEVARDNEGNIVEDITTEDPENPYIRESLAKTLKDIEEGKANLKNIIDGPEERYSVIEGAVSTGTYEGIRYTPNIANGAFSHAEGLQTTANGNFSHTEGGGTIASGNHSHAEGLNTLASGIQSHTEGIVTVANGEQSHAEGSYTTASGVGSHAEGSSTSAKGRASHTEGIQTITIGEASHAEGWNTTAQGFYSHAEGTDTYAVEQDDHAEGYNTIASGGMSHVEGQASKASGLCSHAEGDSVLASNWGSHAEGRNTTASGEASHAAGAGTIANYCQTVVGSLNEAKGTAGSYTANSGYFIVGSGITSNARANCFRATETYTYGQTYASPGADYAEMFEWLDSNPNNEDRVGKFVTLDGNKIKLATSNDTYILGVVSGNASVIGNVYDDQWRGMFETDIYGRPIYTKQHIDAVLNEDGNELVPAHDNDILKVNENYDNTKTYVPRSQRPEWDAIGLVGQLICLDDGTAVVNEYIKVNNNSIATYSSEPTKYRVMERINENHIKIMIL